MLRQARPLAFFCVAAFLAARPLFADDTAAVTKTITGPSVVPGQDITYSVHVQNLSPAIDALNVVLTDSVPLNMTFVSAVQSPSSPGPAFSCTTPASGSATGTISCTTATFPHQPNFEAVFLFTFHVSPFATGTVTNTASVSTSTADTVPADNTATRSDLVAPLADVGVTKTGPATAIAGNTITYTISIANAGPSDSSNVQLNDIIPGPQLKFVSFTHVSGPVLTCPIMPPVGSGGTLSCTTPVLPAGSASIYQLVAQIQPNAPSTIFNTANVSAGTPDIIPGNNSSTATTTLSLSSDLGVTKSGPLTATAGQPITYTIVISNSGPSDAPTIEMDDTLPSTLTFESISPNPAGPIICFTPAVGSSGLVRCQGGSYAAGSTTTFTLVARVRSNVANGASISNTATVSGPPPIPWTEANPFNNSSTVTTTIGALADLSVSKVAGAGTVNPGGSITYTVVLSNSGPSDAASVALDDVVPTGTTFISETHTPPFICSAPGVGSTGNIHCTAPSLASGATNTFTFTVQNNSGNAGGTVISNTATASTTTGESTLANNSSSANVTVTAAALAVTKSGSPNPVQAGTNITYTVTVSNTGTVGAHDVAMTDNVPANTTFVSNTQTAGPSFACTNPAVGATGTISCTNALLAAGNSATFSIVVRVNPTTANGTTITNTANASTSDTDPNLSNNSATATTTVAVTSDVVVTKSGPATVGPGGNITYTVAISNSGTSDAQGVTLSDTLPPGTTFVSETQTSGGAFACSNPAAGGTGTISCTVSTLGAGASATFSIVLAATAGVGTTITNTASGSSTSADANPANNSSSASTTVAGPDLSVTKSDSPDPVTAGNNITYTVTVMNNGTAGADNVSLVDAVPANTTFVSNMQTAGPSFACSNPGGGGSGTITCTNALLGPAISATFQIIVQVVPGTPASTVITNTATASTTDSEPNTTNNSATATTTVSATSVADLIVSKSDAPDPVNAGGNITYTITVTNSGSAAAANVSLTDSVPANTTFVSFSAPGGWTTSTPVAGGTGTVTASNASLAASTSATFTLVVAVGAGVAGGTIISNTATVATTSTETTTANNSATATTTVAAASADVSLSKMAVTASGQITYTIQATNMGPVAATSVIVSDTLPSGTTLVSATPSQGTCSGTTTVTCPLGSIASGSFATITIIVTAPSVAGGVTNTATVSAANDSNPANDSASATVTVSANIPTLSPLVFALLLAALAAIALRRLNP